MGHKKIVGFGSFDGFHEGHRYFINELKKRAEKVVIIIPPDEVIELIKKRKPRYSLVERIKTVQDNYPDIEVVAGDSALNSWEALKKFKPDMVAVGYDQNDLKEALQKSDIEPFPEIVVIDSHQPEKYKSSLLL